MPNFDEAHPLGIAVWCQLRLDQDRNGWLKLLETDSNILKQSCFKALFWTGEFT